MDNGFSPMGTVSTEGNFKVAKEPKEPKITKPRGKAALVKGDDEPKRNRILSETVEKTFIRELKNLQETEADMAAAKGKLSQIYKRLDNVGLTKDQMKFVRKLDKMNVAEVKEDLRTKLALAQLVGHEIGRQADMFDNKDRTPLEDQAYDAGFGVGLLGKSNVNPWGMNKIEGQNWSRGFNEGNAQRNIALNEEINGDIIKADTGEDGDTTDAEAGEGDPDFDEVDTDGAGEGSEEEF